MPDKYQQIRDFHEIELAKKITEINRKNKVFDRRLKILGIALMIIVIFGWFYFFNW
jgi:hypothetical protein